MSLCLHTNILILVSYSTTFFCLNSERDSYSVTEVVKAFSLKGGVVPFSPRRLLVDTSS